MKRIVSILLSVTFILGLGLSAMAQKTPVVDNRQKRQQRRINHGVKTGTLTRKEAAKLEAGQAKTEAMEAKAKSDGKVTVKERAKLQSRENKTSRRIYRQKHDNQNRR
jgi:hypothetical protein